MGQLNLGLPKPPKKPKRGRPRKYRVGDERHVERPRFDKWTPVHVTLKVSRQVRNLRRFDAYRAVGKALLAVIEHPEFRIVHLSLERDHIHLIVEAKNHVALSAGMKAFQCSAAQHLNRAVDDEQRGTVFLDRYFARIIESPTQMRRALSYVLNNWRKHGEHKNPTCANWQFDWFSTACLFDGWHVPPDPDPCDLGWTYRPLPVHSPSTWLLAKGWRKAGSIAFDAIPSA